MNKYFYTDGTNNFGPFTLEELKLKNITRETNVWFQGLSEWAPAGNVAELNVLFKLVPPARGSSNTNHEEPVVNQTYPITNANENNSQDSIRQTPPKTWLVESILATLFCCLPLGIVGIVNAAKVESCFSAGDIQGANNYSDKAKKWTTYSFWIGLVFGILYFLITFIADFMGYSDFLYP